MRIFLCGASGFIGQHLKRGLIESGHSVISALRQPRNAEEIGVDYCTDTQPETWHPRLAGIDVVINAVGVLRDSPRSPMGLIHTRTPQALFKACAECGIQRVVQFSALGVGGAIRNHYFDTRLEAEKYLHTLNPALIDPARIGLERRSGFSPTCRHECRPTITDKAGRINRHLILRPSLIYGDDGASARFFRFLAARPLHLLPIGGEQTLRPVHIDDITEAVTRWLGDPNATSATVAAVGLEETTLRGLLDSYRAQQGHSPARHISIPRALMRLTARLGDLFPTSLLCSETLDMLLAGNTADVVDFTRLLGHPPRSYRDFIHKQKP